MMVGEIVTLVLACAPGMPPKTMLPIIIAESGGHQFAIGANRGKLVRQPESFQEAVVTADQMLHDGISFGAGIAQIDSSNFKPLGLTTVTVFDPCVNMQAASGILSKCYQGAPGGPGQVKLRYALSCYNTGKYATGLHNGYVQRILTIALQIEEYCMKHPDSWCDMK